MIQNVLITGVNGQLGQDCKSVFKDLQDVVGFDLPDVDFSNRAQCLAVLNDTKPDLIINCAAYTAVDACETDKSCWLANAELPGHLAEWVDDNGAHLVHVSTDYVFSGDKPLFEALYESEIPNPISEYGKSKRAGEEAIIARTKNYSILRTAWLYGANGRNFLKTMLKLTLQNPEKEFKVVNDQYGSPTWSYTLARQIRAIAEKQAYGLFHASSEGYCTWYDLACEFLEKLGLEHRFIPCSSDEFPTPTKRPANSIMENDHAKKLGINVFGDWRDDLSDFVRIHGNALLNECLLDVKR